MKQSPPHAVALVELYTSEGCSSCPPADRWLSRLLREEPGPDRVVPLAFHVDYWDRLGWKDRFASPRYAKPARAGIRLELEAVSPSHMAIKAAFRGPPASQAFVALYENNLATDVKAGENEGATLRHDYVVREWLGPIEVPGKLEKTVALQADWKAGDLGVAAFVQDGPTLLQATALAGCIR